jgi:hypothetical protein
MVNRRLTGFLLAKASVRELNPSFLNGFSGR